MEAQGKGGSPTPEEKEIEAAKDALRKAKSRLRQAERKKEKREKNKRAEALHAIGSIVLGAVEDGDEALRQRLVELLTPEAVGHHKEAVYRFVPSIFGPVSDAQDAAEESFGVDGVDDQAPEVDAMEAPRRKAAEGREFFMNGEGE